MDRAAAFAHLLFLTTLVANTAFNYGSAHASPLPEEVEGATEPNDRPNDAFGIIMKPGYQLSFVHELEGLKLEHELVFDFGLCYARHGHKVAGKICIEAGFDTDFNRRLVPSGGFTGDITGVFRHHWGFGVGIDLKVGAQVLDKEPNLVYTFAVGPVLDRTFDRGPIWSVAFQASAAFNFERAIVAAPPTSQDDKIVRFHQFVPAFIITAEIVWAGKRRRG